MSKRISDEERLERYKPLDLSAEEAAELLAFDKAVETGEITREMDLKGDAAKVAREMTRTGTRKTTVYSFTKRQRKADDIKGAIIAELQAFLETAQFIVENKEGEKTSVATAIEVTNKEREIVFIVDDQQYTLTLIRNRKKK